MNDRQSILTFSLGWFKIWDSGYDNTTKQWCTQKLISNNGILSVNLPSSLAGGYYLVRPELMSLQAAFQTPTDPRFFIGCSQIFLDAPNIYTLPEDTVSIPGYIIATEPAVTFNITEGDFPYPMPGPPPFMGQPTTPKAKGNVLGTQTEGLFPSDAVAVNANWWAGPLSPYDTPKGCRNVHILFHPPLYPYYLTNRLFIRLAPPASPNFEPATPPPR